MIMSMVFVVFLLISFLLLLAAVVLSLRQRHREAFAEWETTFLDHDDKSPRQLIEEIQNELENSSAESEQRIQQVRELARARERAARQQKPSTPEFVGARAGNAQTVGNPRGSYDKQFYCENGSMPKTSYRVLIENDAGRSDPGDMTILVRSYSYKRPHVWFYTKKDKPVSGTAVLQANSGNGWQDVKKIKVDNATDLKFGCAPHADNTTSSSSS